MKYIISFLLITNLVFGQAQKYKIVFVKNKITAKITDGKNFVKELTSTQTVELNDLLDAVKLKIYKNESEMLGDFLDYLKTKNDNTNFFSKYNFSHKFPKLSKETVKILQVKSVVEINRFRKTQNLPALLFNKTLLAVAQDYADYCTKNNWRSSHTNKEGISCFERIESKLPHCIGTENLYYGFGTPKETIDLLITSPGHLSNLKTDMQFVAVGVSQFDDGSLVYVQNFAGKKQTLLPKYHYYK